MTSPDLRASTPLAVRVACNIGYGLLLLVGSVSPPDAVDGPSVPDVWMHAGAYAVQAVLLFWMASAILPAGTAAGAAFVGSAAFGAAMELLQRLRPDRQSEIRDLVANSLGAAVACGLLLTGRWIQSRRTRRR